MKNFFIANTDLAFISQQTNVPTIRIISYDNSGRPIYGYYINNDLNTSPVSLGILGSFDLFHSSWFSYLPNDSIILNTSTSPFGLRNIDGLFNNLSSVSRYDWGVTGYAFSRLSNSDYSHYLNTAQVRVLI